MKIMDLLSRFRKTRKRHPFQEQKSAALEKILGSLYDGKGSGASNRSSNPAEKNGQLTRHYIPNAIIPEGGTGFVTMDLMSANGKGPKNDDGFYELVAFTRETFVEPPVANSKSTHENTDETMSSEESSFRRAEERIWFIFNMLAKMVADENVVLQPGDALEFRADDTGHPDAYVYISRFSSRVKPFFNHKRMKGHLLLVMELTAEEFEKAKTVSPVNMVNYLKSNQRWPYTLEPSWSVVV